jgi:hypothetical protein
MSVDAAFRRILGKVLDGEERVSIFIFSSGASKKFFDIFDVWLALIRAYGFVLACGFRLVSDSIQSKVIIASRTRWVVI